MSTVTFGGITPYLHYEDAAASLDWLARVFGFEEVSRYVDGDGRVREAEMLVGDELLIIGSAQPENDTSKPARAKQPTLSENFTQIFRTPFEASGTLQAVGFMAQPKEWQRLAKNAGIELLTMSMYLKPVVSSELTALCAVDSASSMYAKVSQPFM